MSMFIAARPQRRLIRARSLAAVLAAALGACLFAAPSAFAQDGPSAAAPDPAPAHPELRPVFEEFGGMEGMTALMDEFMRLLLEDARMRPFFVNVEHDRVKRQLAEQFCAVLGGGCAYSGRDMREAHAAFAIDRADFNALVEVLQKAMDKRDIPFRAQNKLLAKLAPMHREVVNH